MMIEFQIAEVEEKDGITLEFKDYGPYAGNDCVFKKCCKKFKKKGKKHCKSCPKI